MSDHVEQTEPAGQPAARARWKQTRFVVPFGVLALLGIVLVIVVGVLGVPGDEDDDLAEVQDAGMPEPAPEPVDDDDSAADDQTDWAEVYGHWGAEPEEWRDGWNAAVREIGAGFQLEEFEWEQEQHRLPADRQRAEEWAGFEIVEHPDGYVMTALLWSQPAAGEQQGLDTVAMFTALVATSLDIGVQDAWEVLQEDLDIDEHVDPNAHSAAHEVDGLVFDVTAVQGRWELRVTADQE